MRRPTERLGALFRRPHTLAVALSGWRGDRLRRTSGLLDSRWPNSHQDGAVAERTESLRVGGAAAQRQPTDGLGRHPVVSCLAKWEEGVTDMDRMCCTGGRSAPSQFIRGDQGADARRNKAKTWWSRPRCGVCWGLGRRRRPVERARGAGTSTPGGCRHLATRLCPGRHEREHA
jgi:hypothetical protein